MNPFRKARRLIPVTDAALLVPAANAADIPPLLTTGQYKALVAFVDTLESRSNTPATATQKAAFENQLENKHDAAVNKSTALFDRGKKAAQLESQRAVRTGVLTIRRTESGELPALRRDYDVRMNQATGNYENATGRVEDLFDNRNAALSRQIKRLRKQKAGAEGVILKETIQEAIDRRTKRSRENRKLQQEEITDLKNGFRREKGAIRGAKQSATQSVLQNDAEAIVTLRNRGKRIYSSSVRTLQSRRVNQLNDLEAKLKTGRAAIARMPAAS